MLGSPWYRRSGTSLVVVLVSPLRGSSAPRRAASGFSSLVPLLSSGRAKGVGWLGTGGQPCYPGMCRRGLTPSAPSAACCRRGDRRLSAGSRRRASVGHCCASALRPSSSSCSAASAASLAASSYNLAGSPFAGCASSASLCFSVRLLSLSLLPVRPVSSPLIEVLVSSPIVEVLVSSPPAEVLVSSPFFEVLVSSPFVEVLVSSPFVEVLVHGSPLLTCFFLSSDGA